MAKTLFTHVHDILSNTPTFQSVWDHTPPSFGKEGALFPNEEAYTFHVFCKVCYTVKGRKQGCARKTVVNIARRKRVLAALGTEYFEDVLPNIIRHCSHKKALVRNGYLTPLMFLPRSLGAQFQYLQLALPVILDGLANENESVCNAALDAGHVAGTAGKALLEGESDDEGAKY
ncbi:unnamed protein product [Arabis nemorensis]|uniref:Uncharacterized protein n=1 Tax=Arabis nemorensis TaxID=586526 RepID=A0A565CC89_9BRAS|nr:unnamed protein product [Arabis nemorensis]